MLNSIGYGEISNTNLLLAPSYDPITLFQLNNQIFNQYPINQLPININFSPFINSSISNYFFQTNSQIVKTPEKKIVKTIKKTKKKKKKLFEVDNLECSGKLNFITENDITKFNNDQKLKKIHSAHLLKRKVSNKFQKQIKSHANNLIKECNENNPNIHIPLLYSCTKAFREDVKIDTFQKIRNCTIDKFINEDIQKTGMCLNIKNYKIIELIKDIAQKNDDNVYIAKLSNFLFNIFTFI